MSAANAVVVVVDRLGAGYLGPYGNTWIDTPALNRLAAQSWLAENCIADTPDLRRIYRSYWGGQHTLCPREPDPPLARLLADGGVQSTLLTDEAELLNHPLAGSFDEHVAIRAAENFRRAATVDDTSLARLFTAALEWLERAKPPFLLWVHARGMAGPWDAPYELREQFADEDDPPPPEFVEPPERRMEGEVDPDELLGVVQAYAAQVSLFDMCLAALLDGLDEADWSNETLLTLTSPRGYPLGEHGRIGACDDALYGELLHTPWLLRMPGGGIKRASAAVREQALVQPPDLFATLADALGLADTGKPPWGRSVLPLIAGDSQIRREQAVAANAQDRALRTPGWFAVWRRSESDQPPANPLAPRPEPGGELFVKPDDRWEVNEVANRAPAVLHEMEAACDSFERAARAGDRSQLEPLEQSLFPDI